MVHAVLANSRVCPQLGLKAIFDPFGADFSNINASNDLYVSRGVQKAFIEVSKEGSLAAAVTAGDGGRKIKKFRSLCRRRLQICV